MDNDDDLFAYIETMDFPIFDIFLDEIQWEGVGFAPAESPPPIPQSAETSAAAALQVAAMEEPALKEPVPPLQGGDEFDGAVLHSSDPSTVSYPADLTIRTDGEAAVDGDESHHLLQETPIQETTAATKTQVPAFPLLDDSNQEDTTTAPAAKTQGPELQFLDDSNQEDTTTAPAAKTQAQELQFPDDSNQQDTTTALAVKTEDTHSELSEAKYGKGVFKENQPQDFIFSSANEQDTGPVVDLTEAEAAVPIAAPVFLPVLDMINGLRSGEIREVSGEVRCVECRKNYIMTFSFQEKYQDILPFLDRNREEVGPEMLGTRMLSNLKCTDCKRQWTIPIVSKAVDYKDVNWLFLFLGKQLHNTSMKQMRHLMAQCINPEYKALGEKQKLLFEVYERTYQLLQA